MGLLFSDTLRFLYTQAEVIQKSGSLSFKSNLIFTLVFALLSTAADKAASIGNGDVQCQLPSNWYTITLPGGIPAARPLPDDSRVFGIMTEDAPYCPTPRPTNEESSYEKSYWASFGKRMAVNGRFNLDGGSYSTLGSTPFCVFTGTRQTASGLIYCRVSVTSANGKCYALMEVKGNADPQTDADLLQIYSSFTWLHPPQIAWYQPLLHYSDEVAGLPLLLIAVGLGIYLIVRWSNSTVSLKSQVNVCVWAAVLCGINGQFIAGTNSVTGFISILLVIGFALAVIRLQKKLKLAGQEVQMSPAVRKRLRGRFYIIIGAMVLGVAVTDFQLIHARELLWIIVVSNLGTTLMCALIIWFSRKKFFPPLD